MPDAPIIKRRLCHLTLARREWEEIALSLASLPETAEACGPAIAALRARLASTASAPSEMVTIAEPPLTWSPIIIGLAAHVLLRPALLPIAERLRDQMMAQSRHVEGVPSSVHPARLAEWPAASLGDPRRRISSN